MSAESEPFGNLLDVEYTFWISTIVEVGVVSEAGVLNLQEDWLTLHLFPQRQNLSLVILQTLLVHKLQPQFLQNMTTEIET